MNVCASASTVRKPCDGTPSTITSASAHASSSDAVACRLSGKRAPGRYAEFSCAEVISAASSCRRAQSVVGALPAAIAATAVPHEPAPTTPTESRRLLVRARGCRLAPPPRRRRRGPVAADRSSRARATHALIASITRSVAALTCSSAAMRIGSPTTATCATPHFQLGLRPFIIMRCVPHRPTGTTGTPA